MPGTVPARKMTGWKRSQLSQDRGCKQPPGEICQYQSPRREEQAGVNNAPEEIIQRLAEANQPMKNSPGFIFIVCTLQENLRQTC